MDSWKEYIRYGKGLGKRMKSIGIIDTLTEYKGYYKKYKKLPEDMGFKGDRNYKLFVLYNYLKLCFYLPDESKQYIINFVPRRIQKYLLPKTNPLDRKYIVVDKIEFYRLAQNHNLPIPKTYFYTKNGKIYSLNGEEKTKNYIKSKEGFMFFSKIIDGSAAMGAKRELFEMKNLDLKENRLFQDALETHKEIIELAPTKALNCIKISTYLKNSNDVHFQLSFIKLGGENSIVDNIGGVAGGGVAIPIDHKTGCLKDIGYKEVGKTLQVSKIPSTGKIFAGFKVPYYFEAVDLVMKAHKEVFYELKHIGWDVGITNDGPVLIEGNSGADMFAAQMICRPFNYYNDPLIQENLIKK